MKNIIIAIAATMLLAGCASEKALLFGQTQVVGISVGTSPSGATPEIAVGYKDANIAHVPVLFEATDGRVINVEGDVGNNQNDAYSTLGQFEVEAGTTSVSLGKFFATGIAARQLADGFACKISDGKEGDCK